MSINTPFASSTNCLKRLCHQVSRDHFPLCVYICLLQLIYPVLLDQYIEDYNSLMQLSRVGEFVKLIVDIKVNEVDFGAPLMINVTYILFVKHIYYAVFSVSLPA